MGLAHKNYLSGQSHCSAGREGLENVPGLLCMYAIWRDGSITFHGCENPS